MLPRNYICKCTRGIRNENEIKKIDLFLIVFRDGDDDVDCEGTAHLVYVSALQETKSFTNNSATVKINIEGMRCQSCVKNIETTIGSRSEILSIKVVLEEKLGYIEYKADEITAAELVEAIEDMGFTASLHRDESSSVERNQKSCALQSTTSTCSIHVDGMTCMSCVKTITGK